MNWLNFMHLNFLLLISNVEMASSSSGSTLQFNISFAKLKNLRWVGMYFLDFDNYTYYWTEPDLKYKN